tara:strand:+ start:1200 stop:1502 length:303 start_codon:yes stop_codon:yes gene_type:complete
MKKRIFFLIGGIILIIISFLFGLLIAEVMYGSGLEGAEGLGITLPKPSLVQYLSIGLEGILYNPLSWIGAILIIVYIILAIRGKKTVAKPSPAGSETGER